MRRSPVPALLPAPPSPVAPGERALLALILAGQAGLLWSVRAFFTDDAWISLRYALRFARGDGPVWNAGGPVVEGYSNPLLVFAEALFMRLGGDGHAFAVGQGVAAAFATTLALWGLSRRFLGQRGALVAAAIFALSPSVAWWTVGGLETTAYTLLLTTAALLLAREGGTVRGAAPMAGALLAILPWLRPEGAILAFSLALASELPACLRGEQRGVHARRLAWLLGPVILGSLALQGLRWQLYFHVFPNPVLFKTGRGPLGEVAFRFLREVWPVLPLTPLGFLALRGRARLVAVAPAIALCGSLLFRDSVNEYHRLLLPTWTGWAALAAAGVVAAARRARPAWEGRVSIALAGGLVAALALLTPASASRTHEGAERYGLCRAVARAKAGDWLRGRLRPGDTYAVADAGLLPFRADGHAHDIFGLNEASLPEDLPITIARRAAQITALHPDWLVLSSRSMHNLHPRYKVEKALVAGEDFTHYTRVRRISGSRCRYDLWIYQRTERP